MTPTVVKNAGMETGQFCDPSNRFKRVIEGNLCGCDEIIGCFFTSFSVEADGCLILEISRLFLGCSDAVIPFLERLLLFFARK